MARDILGGFGRDSSQPQAAPAKCGGICPGDTIDVNNYAAPQGPKNIMDPKSPGLHGANYGITNGPDRGGSHSGRPGIGGTNRGNSGSQGKY
jgi:hypothetical protein